MAEAAVEQVGQHSSDEDDFFSSMKSRRSQDGGLVFDSHRRVIKTKEEAMNLFKEFHASPIGGHTGTLKTRAAICSRFYWYGMTVDIDKWISECDQCQRVGPPLNAVKTLDCIKMVWKISVFPATCCSLMLRRISQRWCSVTYAQGGRTRSVPLQPLPQSISTVKKHPDFELRAFSLELELRLCPLQFCFCRRKNNTVYHHEPRSFHQNKTLVSICASFPTMDCSFSAAVRLVVLGLLLYTGPASSVSVTVFPGETATLPCSAPYRINDITEVTVQWIIPDLGYVLVFQNRSLYPNLQLSSFKSRVALADPELKNGDLSMILKNVMKNDEGLYECYIIDPTAGNPAARQRAASDNEPIQTIDLKVREKPVVDSNSETQSGGDENKDEGSNGGMTAGIIIGVMFVCCAAAVVGFFVRRKIKKSEPTVTNEHQDVDLEQAPLSGSG